MGIKPRDSFGRGDGDSRGLKPRHLALVTAVLMLTLGTLFQNTGTTSEFNPQRRQQSGSDDVLQELHGKLQKNHRALEEYTKTQAKDWDQLKLDTKSQLDKVAQDVEDTKKSAQSSEERISLLQQELKQHYIDEIKALKDEIAAHRTESKPEPKKEVQTPSTQTESPPSSSTVTTETSYETNSPYAYVLMNWNLNPNKSFGHRAYLANMLLTAKVLRTHGSKADIVAIFRLDNAVINERLPPQDEALLRAMNISIRYLSQEEPDFTSRRDTKYFLKFHTYSMIEYRRVLVLDGDVLPIANLDYLFDLSEAGILKPYVVLAGIMEPSNGGFFLATPSMEAYNRAQQLIRDNWETAGLIPKFDRQNGWGHPFVEDHWENNVGGGKRWDFLGAWCDQGLHYHMTKYELQNVTQIFSRKIVHWGRSANGTTIAEKVISVTSPQDSPLFNFSKQQYNFYPQGCPKWTGREKPNWPGCVPPYSDFEHFSGKGKVWKRKVPEDLWEDMSKQPKNTEYLWWQLLYKLKSEDGLDVVPLLEAINKDTDWNKLLLGGPPKGVSKTADGEETGQETEPGPEPADDKSLTDVMLELPLGWASTDNNNNNDNNASSWLEDLCPEVVAHYKKFPQFLEPADYKGASIPLTTSVFAARMVCTYSVTQRLLGSLNAKLYLHAGSHLGAVAHGGPIPWDDDTDALAHFDFKDRILEVCTDKGEGLQVHPQVWLRCRANNALKLWLITPEEMADHKHRVAGGHPREIPFLDLFFFKVESGRLWEVDPTGRKHNVPNKFSWAIEDYFPTRPYYFGGIYALGPPRDIVDRRYNLQKCVVSRFNHRVNRHFPHHGGVDCQKLKHRFPFVDDATDTIRVLSPSRNHTTLVFPASGTTIPTRDLTVTSVQQRLGWYNASEAEAQNLTDWLPNLDKIEIDNTISPHDECVVNGKDGSDYTSGLNIVEYNAERGRWWLEAAHLEVLRKADIIILNEMDIGMARSDQQHTTRLLAHFLGMNYAWGLEFVELTEGDKSDRTAPTEGLPNFYGLHGNAFLTRCKITDPIIYRNPVGEYFSHRRSKVNARGLERRLGGRMGMLGRVSVNGKELVVGSVHKLDGFDSEIKDYIGTAKAIIAGDQPNAYCNQVGLTRIVSHRSHTTFPASCSTFGNQRGDNMCSNMKVVDPENVTKPCITEHTIQMALGDHALTGASFTIED